MSKRLTNRIVLAEIPLAYCTLSYTEKWTYRKIRVLNLHVHVTWSQTLALEKFPHGPPTAASIVNSRPTTVAS